MADIEDGWKWYGSCYVGLYGQVLNECHWKIKNCHLYHSECKSSFLILGII